MTSNEVVSLLKDTITNAFMNEKYASINNEEILNQFTQGFSF